VGPNCEYLSPRDPRRVMQPARGHDLSSRWTVHAACQLSFSMVRATRVPGQHLGCRLRVPPRHVPGAGEPAPRVPRPRHPGRVPPRHPGCRRPAPGAGEMRWRITSRAYLERISVAISSPPHKCAGSAASLLRARSALELLTERRGDCPLLVEPALQLIGTRAASRSRGRAPACQATSSPFSRIH
jgi:hypothetical protein